MYACRATAGDQLVVSSYEPDKTSQIWSIDGSLLRWCGGPPGEWQVVGLKPPVESPQRDHCLYVGPLDTLLATQWLKEFVYIST